MNKIAVVIPVFNNEKTIAQVIQGVLVTGLPILVVNDGSTDKSIREIAHFPVTCIHFPKNRGKGQAIRKALKWAKENAFTHIITIDADGQHNPADIPRFIKKINACPQHIIIGKRVFQENVPGKSRFGRWWSNLWIRITSGSVTTDSQSGFRAYPVLHLADMIFLGSRYEFEVEILVRAVWAGIKLDHVDVSVVYFEGQERVSHFKPFRDNFRISIIYTLLVLRKLLLFPHRKRVKETKND